MTVASVWDRLKNTDYSKDQYKHINNFKRLHVGMTTNIIGHK